MALKEKDGQYKLTLHPYRVGYGDASHFTREYKRLFGAPPARDVERLREVAIVSAGL